jgi:Na+/melibiose symporter-like transporter
MLNELTPKEGERVALNAYRHAWSIVANIFVYAVTWLLLDHNQTNDNTQMDANVFRILTYIIVITGIFTSLIFHLGSKESSTGMSKIENDLNFIDWICYFRTL